MPRRQRLALLASSGLFGLLMLGMLAGQLVTVERQREIAARQEQRVQTFLRLAAPTTTRAREGQQEVIAGLLRADDLVRRLRRLDTPDAIAAAGEIAESLEATGAPRSIAAAGALAQALRRSGAPDAIAESGDLARALTGGDRAVELIDRVVALTRAAQANGTVDDVDATRQLTVRLEQLATRLDRTTRQTQTILKDSFTVQRQLLGFTEQIAGIAQATLQRVESIDRRLGGAP